MRPTLAAACALGLATLAISQASQPTVSTYDARPLLRAYKVSEPPHGLPLHATFAAGTVSYDERRVIDEERLLSGHREDVVMPSAPALPPGPWGIVTSHELTAWSGPWGVTYARNLTPDENTGLGIWTEEMFIQALRTGRHMGVSRPIQPPMPWQVYGRMSDEDLKSIYAYLRSIRPVHNRVPEPKLADPELAAWSAN